MPSTVTVVGGGISGLSAALHLSRRFPPRSGTRIILVDHASRLGGWVRSERVRVRDLGGLEADVLLESGPRTLRPTSKAILELVHLLNLTPTLLTVPRTAPAARNRFLHLPRSDGLTTIPNSLLSLLRSPLAKLLVPGILQDVRALNGRVLNQSSPDDESVDTFLSRHFGDPFAQIFGSALIHGIYATDSRLLSVRAAFPVLCQLEQSGKGSVVRGVISDMFSAPHKRKEIATPKHVPYELGDVAQLMEGVSVYSFRDGMQTLTDAMESRLYEHSGVETMKGDGITMLKKAECGFELTTESGKRITSSHIVTALPLTRLHHILAHSYRSDAPFPHLQANPSSSVTVVNLVFPPTPTPIHPEGFGYLIPRPAGGYPAPGSSLGMLGTVFDSCALPTQDRYLSSASVSAFESEPKSDPAPASRFTRLTVMLGGPYGTPSPAPSSPAFVPTLLDALRSHLGRSEPLPEPALVRVRQHRECIPTPTVGHRARMAELGAAVREHLGHNAVVIGAGVGGVSVGDCVEAGRLAALEI
ncbi:Protoporphyrinogen oxidase [Daedaleopsis nitida]|nr:Protoporphyrinogen oxidase [Daedaleopsis nitida]